MYVNVYNAAVDDGDRVVSRSHLAMSMTATLTICSSTTVVISTDGINKSRTKCHRRAVHFTHYNTHLHHKHHVTWRDKWSYSACPRLMQINPAVSEIRVDRMDVTEVARLFYAYICVYCQPCVLSVLF